MKKFVYVTAASIGLLGTLTVSSQQLVERIPEKPQPVKHTFMERFEPDFVLTVSEREKLKAKRFAEIKSKMRILDTLDISEPKREKLINALIEDPFSPRLSKTWADIKFENSF